MDRINIKFLVEGRETNLQLDKKAMPGEAGPCYMISDNGCFKGYIAKQKSGGYQAIGAAYFSSRILEEIGLHLNRQIK